MRPNGLPIEETVSHIRQRIKSLALLVKDCKKDHSFFKSEKDSVSDHGEMLANLIVRILNRDVAAERENPC